MAAPDVRLIREVLGYFVRNRWAVDSLQGIARFRLLEETVRRNVDDTSRALEWLVRQRFLQTVPSAGSPPLYRLNQERFEEAQEMVSRNAADV